MNFAFSLFGKVVATFALLMLVFDGFGDELDGSDITRLGFVAIGGALLAYASRRGGRPPWARSGGKPWAGGGMNLTEVAKYAIDKEKDPTS